MFKKFKSLRLQFLVIALSLAVITSVLGLSAYLVDTKSYNAVFKTASGSDLGFSIVGETFDQENLRMVTPGDSINIGAVAKVTGNVPLYLFVEIDTPAKCTQVGFNSEQWHPVPGKPHVYYYGSSSQLYPLNLETGGSANILSSLILNDNAEKETTFTFSITGYAIQQEKLEKMSGQPAAVFALASPASATSQGEDTGEEGAEGGT